MSRTALARPQQLPLDAYPRPADDNGWGVHWAPTLLTQSPDVVDRYLAEVDALQLRWIKIMQPDRATLEHQYLLAQLAQRGIEPVLRVHKTYNDAYEHLDPLVQAGVTAGVDYYELYSNVNVAGLDGGWRSGQPIDVDGLARHWIDAARTVRAAGGYPGLPSLAPSGAIEDTEFLRRFLFAVEAQGGSDALEGAWLPVQNYMSNLPLDSLDGFRKFERYHRIVQEMTGRTLPILSTEGGAIVGDREDPRYPAMTDELVAERTAQAFAYVQSERPDYYFAFMPWLLVNAAAGGYEGAWEAHAWFPADAEPRPVVTALRQLADGADRPVQPSAPPADLQHAQQTPAQPIEEATSEPIEAAASQVHPLPDGEQTDDEQAGDEQTDAPSSSASAADARAEPQQTTERTLSSGGVTLSEGTITLPTYDYESAFVHTQRGDPIYPAPRLDHERVGAPTPRSYRALVLENDFLRLTILPELGGRIYRWEDKVSGRDILYHNPVVKPTRWGVRGWWLALGGMEWSFPLPDHGLNEYKPWQAKTIADSTSAAVRLTQNGPDGLVVEITVALNADARYFAVTTELHNGGTAPIETHFWNNAMLAPGADNRVDPNSRLVWPAEQFIVHGSAGTRSLPMGATIDWPDGSGEDVSRLANWPQRLSFFAAPGPQQGAVGLVDPDGDLAVIRSFPHRLVPGIKSFYGAHLDPALWTDDGSGPYFELWGGPSRDFDTPVTLAPSQTLRWSEQWYTVPGLGAFVAANAHAALALSPVAEGTELRLASTGSTAMRAGDKRLIVRVDAAIVSDQTIAVGVDELHRQVLPQRLAGRHWIVQLLDAQNRVLFAYDSRTEVDVPPLPAEPIEWDPRLDDLGIDVIPADVRPGQVYWKAVKAEFQNPEEGGGRHHIYIEVLDESGERLVGETVEIHWPDGSATVVTEDKPAPEYAANFPMYGDLGGYSVKMPGRSDTVTGMGLPFGRMHVVYNIVFQRVMSKE